MGSERYSIFVDVHEPESIFKKLSEFSHIEPIRQKLDAGDYYIPTDKCTLFIERKTVMDYINSVFDTRLWDELQKIKEAAQSIDGKGIPMLLIEGDWKFVFKYGHKRDRDAIGSIYASLLSTIASWGVQVISSPAMSWTPYVLSSFTSWLGRPKKSEPPILKPKAVSLDEQVIRVLASFPYISVNRAKAILKHYETLENALESVGWWDKSIPGIGPKIREAVKAVLKHKVKILELKTRQLV